MGVKQQQLNVEKKKKRKDNKIPRLLSKEKTMRAAAPDVGHIMDVGSHTPSSEQKAQVPCSSCLHCTKH